jgi:Tol biopolymer transport system component
VLVTILVLSTACQWTPPGKPQGQLLVILSHWGSVSETYELIDLKGRRSDIAQTLGVTGMPYMPAVWSPSGERLAYRCGIAGDERSFICDIDIASMTMRKYPLDHEGFADKLVWAPDGMSLLFVWERAFPGRDEIRRLDRITQEISVISQLPAVANDEAWSPGLSQIAWVSARPLPKDELGVELKEGDLLVQGLDGTGRRMLHADVRGHVTWSPNGEMIAFVTGLTDLDSSQICWVRVADGEAECVQTLVGDLAWAPDSEHIAFAGDNAVRILNTKTDVVQTLIDLGDEGAYSLNWSLDGKCLAFAKCYSAEANQGCEIHIVSGDGKEHRRLTRNRFADEFPVWQPIVPNTD